MPRTKPLRIPLASAPVPAAPVRRFDVHISLSEAEYRRLEARAGVDHRPVANLVKHVLLQWLHQDSP
jgi:hypothetical protein